VLFRSYRVRFTDLLEWILTLPHFEGKKEESSEGHLEMIQSAWVYEWRDNQKK
jgi:FeS assembly protein IscX